MKTVKDYYLDSDGVAKYRMVRISDEEFAQDQETKRLYQFNGFQQEIPACMMDKCEHERAECL